MKKEISDTGKDANNHVMNLWHKLRCFITCLWVICLRCFFVIIVCFIGYFALAVNDQGQDLILSIGDRYHDHSFIIYMLKLHIGIFIWSVSLWYCSQLLLQLASLSKYEGYGIGRFIKWSPRIFGIFPFIVLVISLFTVISNNPEVTSAMHVAASLLILEAGVMLLFFSNQRSIFYKLKIKQHNDPFAASAISFKSLWLLRGFKAFLILWALVYFLFFTLFLASSGFAIWLMPGAIILIGMGFLTVLLSVLSHFNDWNRRPVFIYLLLLIGFCALFNDNTSIRQRANNEKNSLRESNHAHFAKWVAHHTPDDTAQTVPIIFIAAQGGGVRAMYWTAAVLAQLDSTYNGFYEHTYAISGVSGGGVGSVFFQTYYKDIILNDRSKRIELPAIMDTLTTGDFLSPVTSAFLFSDNLQKILPYPIEYLNRTRWLEDSWSDYYKSVTQIAPASLDDHFLNLWLLPDSLRYRLPSLLINGTVAETGQKIITSNLVIDPAVFNDVIDLEGVIDKDVPIKTAASLCSRFPGITSSGLFVSSDKKMKGRIVDGGYAENTGIETMITLYAALRDDIENHNKSGKFKIQPLLLFIKNSKETSEIKPITIGLETRVPLSAFFNAWGRRAPITSKLASDYLNTTDSICYHQIELDRNEDAVHLPLGWFLSGAAKMEIGAEARGMLVKQENNPLRSNLDKLF